MDLALAWPRVAIARPQHLGDWIARRTSGDHAAGQLEDWLPIGIGAIGHSQVALLETGKHPQGHPQVIETMQVPLGHRPIAEQGAIAAPVKAGLRRVCSAVLPQPPIGAEDGLVTPRPNRDRRQPSRPRPGRAQDGRVERNRVLP